MKPIGKQYVNANLVPYTLVFSQRRKTLALQIRRGELIVRAPIGASLQLIETVIQGRLQWIKKQRIAFEQQTAISWIEKKQLPLLERVIELQVRSAERSYWQFEHDTLYVYLSSKSLLSKQKEDLKAVINAWYEKKAQQWFSTAVKEWQQIMGVVVGKVVVGNWKSRWGYCKSNSDVGFNWRLMMAPEWVANYVVVHELAHIKHLNHSAEYWCFVSKFFPDYKKAKYWLAENQFRLDI